MNTQFWNQLQTTDPRITKNFQKSGGFKGTDINPTWRMKRMTEVFGPCGKGWGWNLERTWSEQIGDKTFMFAAVDLWWTDGIPTEYGDLPRYCTGAQIGGTEAGRAPDEAYKMAITDALGKCMVALGLASDIYMGLWDDSKYQADALQVHQANDQMRAFVVESVKTLKANGGDVSALDANKMTRLKVANPAAHAEIMQHAAKVAAE